MYVVLHSKPDSHKQIDEADKSDRHQGGHCTPYRGRALGTKVINTDSVRSRQRRSRKVNLRQTIGGVGDKAPITIGVDDITGENIDKLCVPAVARLGDVPRSGTVGTNVSEQG